MLLSPDGKKLGAALVAAAFILGTPLMASAETWSQKHAREETAPVTYARYRAPQKPVLPQPVPTVEPQPEDPISLLTQSGLTLGAHFGRYRYQENVVPDEEFMHLSGYRGGVSVEATQALEYGLFITGDTRFTYGENTYVGSGTSENVDDQVWEMRALFGKDFVLADAPGFEGGAFTLAAYTGFGYRHLYNDSRGETSSGAVGYRRTSEYLYMPIGITPRFRLDQGSRLSTTFEFDYLLQGLQTSYLSDVTPLDPDIENKQKAGYGLRANAMYETSKWSVGPYVQYWNIQNSAGTVFYDLLGNGFVGHEPHNYTLEYGMRGTYRFGWSVLEGVLF